MHFNNVIKYSAFVLTILTLSANCWSSNEKTLPELFADVHVTNVTYPPITEKEVALFQAAEDEQFHLLSESEFDKEIITERLVTFYQQHDRNATPTVIERLCRWYYSLINEESSAFYKRNCFEFFSICGDSLMNKLDLPLHAIQTLVGISLIHNYDRDPQRDRLQREADIINAFYNSLHAKEIQGIFYFLHCLQPGILNDEIIQALAKYRSRYQSRCFQFAAELGDIYAMRICGDFLVDSPLSTVGEKRKGLNWLKKAADSGDYTAMNNLGFARLQGVGLDPNRRESNSERRARIADAVALFQDAADRGIVEAIQNLANLYFEKTIGHDLSDKERYEISFKLRLQAHEGGDVNAEINLLACYLHAAYSPHLSDEERNAGALKILENLANKELEAAYGCLPKAYRDPELNLDGSYTVLLAKSLMSERILVGLEKKDRENKAWQLLNRASYELQFPQAMYVLAYSLLYSKFESSKLLPDNLRINKAIEWLEKAHAKDNQKATILLYKIYANGFAHIQKDSQKALQYLRSLSEKQDEELQGLYHLRAGEVKKAIRALKFALKRNGVVGSETEQIINLLESKIKANRGKKANNKKKKSNMGSQLASALFEEGERMKADALKLKAELSELMKDDDYYLELLSELESETDSFIESYSSIEALTSQRQAAANVLEKVQDIQLRYLLAKAERQRLTELEITIDNQAQRESMPSYMRTNNDTEIERRKEQRRIKQMAAERIEKEKREAHLRRTKPGSKGPVKEESKPLEMEPVELLLPYTNIGINFTLDESLRGHYQAKLNDIRDAIRNAHGENLRDAMNAVIHNLSKLPGDYNYKQYNSPENIGLPADAVVFQMRLSKGDRAYIAFTNQQIEVDGKVIEGPALHNGEILVRKHPK